MSISQQLTNHDETRPWDVHSPEWHGYIYSIYVFFIGTVWSTVEPYERLGPWPRVISAFKTLHLTSDHQERLINAHSKIRKFDVR